MCFPQTSAQLGHMLVYTPSTNTLNNGRRNRKVLRSPIQEKLDIEIIGNNKAVQRKNSKR